jgi:hypothetical protein
MLPRLLSPILCLIIAAPAFAAPPAFTTLQPRGAQRGSAVTVVVTGANLTASTRFALPFKATQKHLPDPKPNPAQVRLELTVDAGVAPGIYPVRLVNEEGLSGLALFRVDTLGSVAEAEDNNTFEKAQKVAWPVVVDGQCPGGDVDHFRFTAKKGQRIVVEVESARLGSAVLPQLRLTDAKKQLLASDDSQSLAGDGRVVFTAPADGDYVVELSDSRYRGGNPAFYRLRIAEYDYFDEVFPLGGRRGESATFTLRSGSLGKPVSLLQKLDDGPFSGRMAAGLTGLKQGVLPPWLAVGELTERIILRKARDTGSVEIKPPLVVNGRLDRAGQVDRFRFAVTPGSRWRLVVEAEALGSRLDGVLVVADDKGRQLVSVDDVDMPIAPGQPPVRTSDPAADVTVPPGVKELLVSLRDQRGRGGVGYPYRLTVRPAEDDFTLALPVAELNVPRGGAVALTVPMTRRGYNGAVKLAIPSLPPGLRVQGGNVPPGGTAGVLTIAADSTGGNEPVLVQLQGQATINRRLVQKTAVQRLVLAREAGAAGVYVLPKLAVARTSAVPFQLGPPGALTLVKGYPAEIPVKLMRYKGQEKLAITVIGLLPGPAGFTFDFTFRPRPASTAGEVRLKVTPGVAVPEGTVDLAVVGQARIGQRNVRLAAPAVPVTVKAPFELQLTSPVVLRPGETVKVSGKIIRESVFKEVVRLALTGLPPGVTAVPLKPVAAAESKFLLELKADPKAAPTAAKLELRAAATITGQNYAHAPVMIEAKVEKR